MLRDLMGWKFRRLCERAYQEEVDRVVRPLIESAKDVPEMIHYGRSSGNFA